MTAKNISKSPVLIPDWKRSRKFPSVIVMITPMKQIKKAKPFFKVILSFKNQTAKRVVVNGLKAAPIREELITVVCFKAIKNKI